MITEGVQLWRTLFSRLCRSINRQSSAKSSSAQKCYSRYQFSCQSVGNSAVSCSSLSSSRSKMSDKSPWSVCAFDSHDTATWYEGTFFIMSLASDLNHVSTARALSLIGCWWLFLPCQHEAVLPAFNWSLCLARDQWPHQSRPIRRRHIAEWYRLWDDTEMSWKHHFLERFLGYLGI